MLRSAEERGQLVLRSAEERGRLVLRSTEEQGWLVIHFRLLIIEQGFIWLILND